MKLRDYQEQAVNSIINYYADGKDGNCVVAMPTGTGKSLVIAGFLERVLTQWPDQRVLVLTHVKELIEQNAAKLQQYWPTAPMGIYSAGLNQRDTVMPIIFGGEASVANCVPRFGRRDLVMIDECHLLSPKDDTTYQNILSELKEVNPYLKVIGLSATPFRLGQGMITDGGVFTDICCDMTGVEAFNKFIEEGYLAPLVPRPTTTQIDLSDVSLSGGEFVQGALQKAIDKTEVTYKALAEMCEKAADRNSWLIFATGVEHAEHISEMLDSFGISCAAIHSKMSKTERDNRLKDYKSGRLRCLVNNNVLTTGFDHPPLDFIGMLRPTMSPGLWVQMLGRGTRPSLETGKQDCLVLDFAGNTRRLGPINDPVIPRKKGKGGGDAPVRICEHCGTYNHAAARFCTYCKEEITFQTNWLRVQVLMNLYAAIFLCLNILMCRKFTTICTKKSGSAPSIRVEYFCDGGMHKFNEWVCLEHSGFPGKKARDWWRQRFPGDYVPDTTADGLKLITELRVPHRIKVHINKKNPEVINYEYQ